MYIHKVCSVVVSTTSVIHLENGSKLGITKPTDSDTPTMIYRRDLDTCGLSNCQKKCRSYFPIKLSLFVFHGCLSFLDWCMPIVCQNIDFSCDKQKSTMNYIFKKSPSTDVGPEVPISAGWTGLVNVIYT